MKSTILFCLAIAATLLTQTINAESGKDLTEFNQAYSKFREYSEKTRWRQALPYAERAYKLGKEIYEPTSASSAALSLNLGITLLNVYEQKRARKYMFEALKLHEDLYGKDAYELVPVLLYVGHSVAEMYQESYEEKYYKRALNITKEKFGSDSKQYIELTTNIGIYLIDRSGSPNAKHYLRRGFKMAEKSFGPKSKEAGYAAFSLAKYKLAIDKNREAVEYFNKAIDTFESPDKPFGQLELSTHGFLVQAYQNLDKPDEATKHCLAIGRMMPEQSTQDYKPVARMKPEYPISARRKGESGWVELIFDVDTSGFVKNPSVTNSRGGDYFVESALEAVKKYRYAPQFKDGEPVVTKDATIRIVFEMAD